MTRRTRRAKPAPRETTPQEATVVAEAPRLAPPPEAPGCERTVRHDSLRWRCGCGATGPVGRSADGMPYVTEEMLRHEPGETKE